MVFLDVEKAFDRVFHAGLLYKMYETQFPDCYIKLIASYLDKQQFSVNVKGATSQAKIIRAGVPQGSILGLALYNIYTHDIPKPLNWSSNLGIYADATVLYTRSFQLQAAIERTQNYLNLLEYYFKLWRIKINVREMRSSYFHSENTPPYSPAHYTLRRRNTNQRRSQILRRHI